MSYFIIQDCISLQVVGEGGRWVQNKAKALRFRTSGEAIEYCHKHQVESYSLAIKFDNADSPPKTTSIFALLCSASDPGNTFCHAFTSAFV